MMTTGELARARTDLEHKLTQPFSDDRKEVLQDDLKAVLAEQEARQKTTGLLPTAWSEV
jgi:hypothetical protein